MSDRLPGQVVTSAARLGFDTVTRLDFTTASMFFASGFRFCVRYISRDNLVSTQTGGSGSMSRAEAKAILGAGLALMPVQFAKRALEPTTSLGQRVGANAAQNAVNLGFPPACSVWCDLEAISSNSTTDDVIAYCNAWYAEVASAGYEPGIYIGPNSRLSTIDLYRQLAFKSYWKSASRVGNVDTRGYQLVQSLSRTLHGVHVDFDIAGVDSLDGRPNWLSPTISRQAPD